MGSKSDMRNSPFMLIVLFMIMDFFVGVPLVRGQGTVNSDDVLAGHRLAIIVCANCHVAASDQPNNPILRPPAPSFASIAQRKYVTAEWLQNYMKTTHRGLDNPNGMPNPELLASQVKQVSVYLLSLRKSP